MRLDNDHSKSSQSPSRNFANGSSQASGPRSPLAKGTNGSTHSRNESNGSYTNGGPVANGGTVPATFFGHDREEVTRILIQSLTDLGYHSAAGALCKESGFQLEGPTVAAFRTSAIGKKPRSYCSGQVHLILGEELVWTRLTESHGANQDHAQIRSVLQA